MSEERPVTEGTGGLGLATPTPEEEEKILSVVQSYLSTLIGPTTAPGTTPNYRKHAQLLIRMLRDQSFIIGSARPHAKGGWA